MSALTQINPIDRVKTYFVAQNNSDAEAAIALFTDEAEVYNVNFPKFAGKDGIRAFCENLYARTSARNFQIVSVAQGDGNAIMAHWEATMSFRPGAKLGPFELARGFDVSLQGINKFVFDESGSICELRIFHETTTVAQLAKENAIS
jgi:limonene-1,2-epoxide hydrolase